MVVQHNVINGICAGRKCVRWASHSDAIPSASDIVGTASGKPNGVRIVRPSSVTVYHDNASSDNGDDLATLSVLLSALLLLLLLLCPRR